MFDYEIIATIGPKSLDEILLEEMIGCGVTAFRLNTSHITIDQLNDLIDRYYSFYQKVSHHPSLYLDLQGSKWRLGLFPTVELSVNQKVKLMYGEETSGKNALPVPHLDFFIAVKNSNGLLTLADGKVCMQIEKVMQDEIIARVTRAGRLSSRKGITVTECGFRKEELSQNDQKVVKNTTGLPFVRYAVSYIKDGQEMKKYRQMLGESAYLTAKLERISALDDVLLISELANELWLCRGDLGAELGLKDMAKIVYEFHSLIPILKKPVILAGQVLEHLVDHPMPTRSEICYCYDALNHGYRGFVLSDETAVGSFIIEACRTAAMFKNY